LLGKKVADLGTLIGCSGQSVEIIYAWDRNRTGMQGDTAHRTRKRAAGGHPEGMHMKPDWYQRGAGAPL
jgi:hypothetical protein